MRKFKETDREQEQLSDQEISKYKDFGEVVANYEKARDSIHRRPLYKDPKTFLALLVILLLVYVIVEVTNDEENSKDVPVEQVVPETSE